MFIDRIEHAEPRLSWHQRTALLFTVCATAAILADLATKAIAVAQLSDRAFELGDRLGLMLLFNSGGAGGMSFGPHTWLINVVGTAATIGLVLAILTPLSKVARSAPLALGLIAGGAAGNLTSLLVDSRGVPDFLALRISDYAVVFNVADLALWGGAILLAPVAATLVSAVRAERAATAQSSARPA